MAILSPKLLILDWRFDLSAPVILSGAERGWYSPSKDQRLPALLRTTSVGGLIQCYGVGVFWNAWRDFVHRHGPALLTSPQISHCRSLSSCNDAAVRGWLLNGRRGMTFESPVVLKINSDLQGAMQDLHFTQAAGNSLWYGHLVASEGG